jgi:hypothetical protein
MIKLDPPDDVRARILAALGPDTTVVYEAAGDRYLIGVSALNASGHHRGHTMHCADQAEVDAGWHKIAELAEAQLIMPAR